MVGADGKLDVGETIRKRAKTVESSELARRHKQVQVVGLEMIRRLIQDAVKEAVLQLERALGEAERQRLLEEAEETFRQRLNAFKAEKAGMEAHASHLQDELQKTRELLEAERQRIVAADQFTMSDASMVELETRLGRMIDRAAVQGSVDKDFEDELRGVVSKLLDDERELIREKAEEAQNDRILLLETKIGRLASTLEDAQQERDRAERRAQALESAGGGALRNVITGGIGEDDPDKVRRLELMKEIIRINREMREELGIDLLEEPVDEVDSPQAVEPVATSAEAEEEASPEEVDSSETFEEDVLSTEEADDSLLNLDAEEDTMIDLDTTEDEAEDAADLDASDARQCRVAGESEVDPDDLPWEAPADEADDSEKVRIFKTGSVQSICAEQKAPPPLLRGVKKKSAERTVPEPVIEADQETVESEELELA